MDTSACSRDSDYRKDFVDRQRVSYILAVQTRLSERWAVAFAYSALSGKISQFSNKFSFYAEAVSFHIWRHTTENFQLIYPIS